MAKYLNTTLSMLTITYLAQAPTMCISSSLTRTLAVKCILFTTSGNRGRSREDRTFCRLLKSWPIIWNVKSYWENDKGPKEDFSFHISFGVVALLSLYNFLWNLCGWRKIKSWSCDIWQTWKKDFQLVELFMVVKGRFVFMSIEKVETTDILFTFDFLFNTENK